MVAGNHNNPAEDAFPVRIRPTYEEKVVPRVLASDSGVTCFPFDEEKAIDNKFRLVYSMFVDIVWESSGGPVGFI